MTAPLIVGAGPAGSMAAILLARAGAEPVLIDRDKEVGDALCGGFMSWRTARQLRAIGLELGDLGAHHVRHLTLFAGERTAHAKLPDTGFGLSRHSLDTAMRAMAVEAGAQLRIDRVRSAAPGIVSGDKNEYSSDAIFLANGKYDVRGHARPRVADDPALGIRIRIPAHRDLTAMLAETIELHFFPGGYVGIVLQEDGSANVCLAVRKSLLSEAGGQPRDLLDMLGRTHPAFARRMAFAASELPIDTIGAVPYGWIARDTMPGLFRLGDQAAVIPSLAGEGMGIALASATMAVDHWSRGGTAPAYQARFARKAARPVITAKTIWQVAETRRGGGAVTAIARMLPFAAMQAMRASRIE
ncbi:MAG: NAD(P)/FAD-dependent oxidoreductase [Pontixanthobacter sp.]